MKPLSILTRLLTGRKSRTTSFRRFKTLRGRKLRQRAQKEASGDPDPEPAVVAARAKTLTWGTVSTIKANAEQIKPFIEHHLSLGAAQMDIFLDAPLPDSDLAHLTYPKVRFIQCDAAYWTETGKPLMEKHQQRQAFNATRAYRDAHCPY
jgi:hypothetical protein